MSHFSRRKLLKSGLAAGVVAATGHLPLPTGKQSATDWITLGKSNVKVTRLAFGTGSFSGKVQRDLGQDEFTRLIRYAYDCGIRFFETAESYGEMHRMLGIALKGIPRETYSIMSKVTTFHDGANPAEKFDELRKLANTDYFDIMLLHWQHTATWPSDSARWQDGILEAQSKKIILGRGASVHGLPALRQKAAERKATFESLVWREGFEEWKPLKEFPELVALVEEARRDGPSDQDALRTIPAPSPLEAAQAMKAKAASSDVPSDLLEQIGARPAKGVSHPVAWTALIVALAFGVTIGIVLFSKTEKQEVVKYVEVPASAKAAPSSANDPMTIEESTVSGGGTKKAVGTAQKTEPPVPVPSGKSGLQGLQGLNGINGLGPATQGPDVTAAANLPGGQLDGNAIQRVVANFSSSVRRGCWDSALASRPPDAPSTARVGVTINIAASGAVDNVTTTGDPKGYPNLAHCIESKVRGWKFPRSNAPTTAQVPFVFAAQ